MQTVMQILIQNISRAQRAYSKSQSPILPVEQRHFHKGRYEAYLQSIAGIGDLPVSDVRAAMGLEPPKKAKATRATNFDLGED